MRYIIHRLYSPYWDARDLLAVAVLATGGRLILNYGPRPFGRIAYWAQGHGKQRDLIVWAGYPLWIQRLAIVKELGKMR
jgi:hypothetical protein